MSRRSRNAIPKFSLFAFQDIITCVTGIMILITLLLVIKLIERTEASPAATSARVVETVSQQLQTMTEEIKELESQMNRNQAILNGGALVSAQVLENEVQHVKDRSKQAHRDIEVASEQLNQTIQQGNKLREEQTSKQPEVVAAAKRNENADQIGESLKKLKSGKRVIYNTPESGGKTVWFVELSASKVLAAKAGVASKPEEFSSVAEFQSWAQGQSSADISLVLLVKSDVAPEFNQLNESLQGKGFSVGFDLLADDQFAIDPVLGAGVP
jgi:hypothetical protein